LTVEALGADFQQLWELVSPELLDAMRPMLGGVIDDIVSGIAEDSAVYDQVLGAPGGLGIRIGIEKAVQGFVNRIEHPEARDDELFDLWYRLGDAEFHTGRSLESLQGAWRAGGRSAWRGAARMFEELRVEPATLAALAEAIFSYSDELSSQVVQGYADAQSDQAGEREHHRHKLARLLADPREHDPVAIARVAALARWQVPAAVAALALSDAGDRTFVAALGSDVLPGADDAGAWLFIPEPNGRAESLRRVSADLVVALGPALAPCDASRSLHWARAALALAKAGKIESDGLVCVNDHLLTVLLHQDDELALMLAQQRLGALDGLPTNTRERLLETLSAWLAHQRHIPTIASELNVHPQTVRYRVSQLREFLGDALDDPAARLELEVALRVSAVRRGGAVDLNGARARG
jgi:hypothetical protein